LYFQHIPPESALAICVQLGQANGTVNEIPTVAVDLAGTCNGGKKMTSVLNCEEMKTMGEPMTACELTELVKGNECGFVDEMTPVVERRSVWLDLERVERIDAAGVSALISLYRTAREAGNCFRIANLTPRVAEVLALVGVDRILVSHNARPFNTDGPRLAQNAA
jgi:anti-anti-sigma factor